METLFLPKLGLGTWQLAGASGQASIESALAMGYRHTAAQVALKWLLDQDGVAAIPKAGRVARQRENLEALSVTLDDADRAAIAAMPKDRRVVNPSFAPAWD